MYILWFSLKEAVMVSKCTGEVCKILHDPKCPPPHNYIATYKYVEDIIGANAIVHIGTGSSLENLPGKN